MERAGIEPATSGGHQNIEVGSATCRDGRREDAGRDCHGGEEQQGELEG